MPHKAWIFVNGRTRWVIKEDGKIINKNPTKEELRGLGVEPYKIKTGRLGRCGYKEGDVCHRCIEDKDVTDKSVLCRGNVCLEKNKDGKETGKYVCHKHWIRDYNKYDPNSCNNIQKSLRNCRTENQDPNHSSTKGDRNLDIVCEANGYENLNKTYDNYITTIDCIDRKTGLYYQVQGICYNPINGLWSFSHLDDEWGKRYEEMILVCNSDDGNIIERIYRIPSKEIDKKRKSIGIYKHPSKGFQWYEQYRVKDTKGEEELKRSNDILQKKLEKEKNKRQIILTQIF